MITEACQTKPTQHIKAPIRNGQSPERGKAPLDVELACSTLRHTPGGRRHYPGCFASPKVRLHTAGIKASPQSMELGRPAWSKGGSRVQARAAVPPRPQTLSKHQRQPQVSGLVAVQVAAWTRRDSLLIVRGLGWRRRGLGTTQEVVDGGAEPSTKADGGEEDDNDSRSNDLRPDRGQGSHKW